MSLVSVTALGDVVENMWQLEAREVEARAERGEAEALFELGFRLRNGEGLERNEELGWRYTIDAARKGHPVALGVAFNFGREVEADAVRAVALYRLAAERNHARGKLMHARAHARAHAHAAVKVQTRAHSVKDRTRWACATRMVMALKRMRRRRLTCSKQLQSRVSPVHSATWDSAWIVTATRKARFVITNLLRARTILQRCATSACIGKPYVQLRCAVRVVAEFVQGSNS